MSTHLVMGDPHAKPGISNNRFTWAAKLALDRRPDTIICVGDWADMPSLSSYDKGKKSFAGRRYSADIEAARDALIKFEQPIQEYNDYCKQQKKAQYRPRKIITLGNHEERILRCVQLHEELEHTIEIANIGFENFGWEVVPYKQSINVDGIFYSHNFATGVSGEPISGLNIAQNLLAKQMMSCTVGHIHLYDHAERVRPDGARMHGLSCGCYFDHDEDYARNTQHMWWRGLIMKNNVVNGNYDIEKLSIKRLEEMYDGHITGQ